MDTFIVRVWEASRSQGRDSVWGLHGVVEHVRSGRQLPFASSEELLELLESIRRGERSEVIG